MTYDFSLRVIVSKINAVIFDMDGVLVDSESQHYRAHKAAIEEFGGTLTKELYSAHGVSRDPLLLYADCFPNRKNDRHFLKNILDRKHALYQGLQKKEGILPIKPAISLVKFLFEKHMPLAVGTGVYKAEAMKNLSTLGIDHYFQTIVTFDEVGEKRKPAPDIYRKVSELLGIPPSRCLVIEDSEIGVQSALSAGMPVVAVPHEFTNHHDFTGAIVVNSFEEIQQAFMEKFR